MENAFLKLSVFDARNYIKRDFVFCCHAFPLINTIAKKRIKIHSIFNFVHNFSLTHFILCSFRQLPIQAILRKTMSTIENSSYNRNQSYIMKRKYFRKNIRFGKVFKSKEQLIEFPCFSLLGGNRKDPLNLNELIQKKKQSTTNNNNTKLNDRLVEILLPPNIFDPLCLDRNQRSISSDAQANFQPTCT
jgi:hypothetical protein